MAKKKLKDVKLPSKDLSSAAEYSNIISWYQDDTGTVKLSPREEILRDRMDFCDNLIRKWGGRSLVVPMLEKKFGVSKKVAYSIYAKTEMAFKSDHKSTKDYWRGVITDWASELRNRALLKGDMKAEAEAQKIIVKTLRLDKLDDKVEDPTNLPQTVIIQYQSNSLGLHGITPDEAKDILEQVLKPKRKQDFNLAEEIEYVEQRAVTDGE